ncbi:MAG: hypothetical protein ACPGYL_09365, partial [Rhodospirillaceae bacterium]
MADKTGSQEPNIIVATAYDDGYAEMGGLCEAHLRVWCQRQGYRLHVERTMVADRPAAWTKIAVLGGLLALPCDWVVWVDADALVLDPEADLRPLLLDAPDKDLHLAIHHLWSNPMPGMAQRYDVPNTGVMALRKGAFVTDLLGAIWDQTNYLTHPWWENAALIHLLGYHRLLDPQGVNQPNQALWDRIAPLPWAWNAVPGEVDLA